MISATSGATTRTSRAVMSRRIASIFSSAGFSAPWVVRCTIHST
jgi:hypothetical protein